MFLKDNYLGHSFSNKRKLILNKKQDKIKLD